MLLSCAIRHGAPHSLARATLTRSRWLVIPLLRCTSTLDRGLRTPARSFATNKTVRRRDGYTYPEKLNIFDSGFVPLFVHTLTRFTSAGLIAAGAYWAMHIAFDTTIPSYWIPVYLLGSMVPALMHGLMVGGFVHHIYIFLPAHARRNKEALINFVRKVPANTRFQMKTFWFRPWAHVRDIEIYDVRRLPAGHLRLTNLEQQPLWSDESMAYAQRHPIWDWWIRSWVGRFYVARDQVKDRSRVPGVWNTIWEQIPMVGEKPVPSSKEAKSMVRRVKTPAQQQSTTFGAKRKRPTPVAKAKP